MTQKQRIIKKHTFKNFKQRVLDFLKTREDYAEQVELAITEEKNDQQSKNPAENFRVNIPGANADTDIKTGNNPENTDQQMNLEGSTSCSESKSQSKENSILQTRNHSTFTRESISLYVADYKNYKWKNLKEEKQYCLKSGHVIGFSLQNLKFIDDQFQTDEFIAANMGNQTSEPFYGIPLFGDDVVIPYAPRSIEGRDRAKPKEVAFSINLEAKPKKAEEKKDEKEK